MNRISSLTSWQLFLWCIGLSVALRALTLHAGILHVDEADFAAQGQLWATGGVPYLDFVEKKPLLSYAFYALPFHLFGWNMFAVHLVVIVWISATAMTLAAIMRRCDAATAAPWTALLYCAWSVCFPATATLPANTENMLNLPSAIAAYCALRAVTSAAKRWHWWLAAGACAGIASLFKHQGGVMLPALIAFGIWKALQPNHGAKCRYEALSTALKTTALLLAGFLLPWLLCSAWLWKHDALAAMIRWNFSNNLYYISASFDWNRALQKFSIAGGGFLLAWLPILWLAWRARHIRDDQQRAAQVLALCWLAGAFVAVSAGGRFSAHYFVQLMPPLILLAGFGLRIHSPRPLIILLIVSPLFWSAIHWIRFFQRADEAQLPVIAEISREAQHLASNPDDRIFVWGYFSYPYYAAQRLPASRFVIGEYLVPYWEKKLTHANSFDPAELTAWHRTHLAELLADFERHPPQVIIDTTQSVDIAYWRLFALDKFPEVQAYVSAHYRTAAKIRGMTLYQRIR